MVQDDDRDWEGEFYKMMAHQDFGAISKNLAKDIIDVTRGLQAGIDSQNIAWLCLPMTQRTVLRWAYAYNALLSHDCVEANAWMWRMFLNPISVMIEGLIQHEMDADVLGLENPWDHVVDIDVTWAVPDDPEGDALL